MVAVDTIVFRSVKIDICEKQRNEKLAKRAHPYFENYIFFMVILVLIFYLIFVFIRSTQLAQAQ
jgi:hypothetical protein